MAQQILVELSNIKYHENPFSTLCIQTDMYGTYMHLTDVPQGCEYI
jgi:hypothetical protein